MIDLKLFDGKKEANLRMSSLEVEEKGALIKGIFNFFEVSTEPPETKPTHEIPAADVLENTKAPEKKEPKPIQKPAPVTKVKEDKEPPTTPRPKQLPLLGAERRMSVPLSDLAESINQSDQPQEQSSEKPDFYITGYKIDEDGTKRYKCRYFCDCRSQANHYIPLGTETVNCYECDAELVVELATGEKDRYGIPSRDDFGNYYVAKWTAEQLENQ
ncbi:hypothetical protein [Desertibacillus haloalkaliphilus]|uniref:hypothetical protein n=1 Tax=Desertibacillus haloalkaliphilus TaxID=1328930 RepID=UPI001C278C73|nr:hypothetical protein [Desertibacillus haloalkaliphilus]MBU8908535.1 hypothetical protein [Desertibacillus haloalkaliphilus]